jgi:hypothetical protein
MLRGLLGPSQAQKLHGVSANSVNTSSTSLIICDTVISIRGLIVGISLPIGSGNPMPFLCGPVGNEIVCVAIPQLPYAALLFALSSER